MIDTLAPLDKSRVAVVTGASSGFGLAIARRIASQGMPVVALARRKDRLEELADELGHDRVHPVCVDVRNAEDVDAALSWLPQRFERVGVLVNNAGVSKGFGPVENARIDHLREMVDTNVMGLLHCTKTLLPMLKNDGQGHIVNVGSIAAIYPYMGGNVYGATKAFVHHLSLNLRTDLEGTGVRVSCVAPGMAKTEFALVRFEGDRDRADALYQGVTPLSPVDVAEAVVWCLQQPQHVNVNLIELMPTAQHFGLGFTSPTTSEKD